MAVRPSLVSGLVSENPVYPFPHRFVHADQRRPRALETFAGNFLRRVDAEFAADGDFAGGVVEHVGRAFGEDAVALRIGVGAETEEDFAGVVHVHVVVHHDDVFGEHHLAHAPEAVHDFVGLHRVGLLDADEDEVVEDAFGRQRDVHDLREVHLEDRQEQFHATRRRCRNLPSAGCRRWSRDKRRPCDA